MGKGEPSLSATADGGAAKGDEDTRTRTNSEFEISLLSEVAEVHEKLVKADEASRALPMHALEGSPAAMRE